LHLLNISTAGSVALIKAAKAKGLKITASVAVMNLVCDDSYLLEYDSNYKVMPPLRSIEDMKALLKGLQDGTIDFITSNHAPLDEESKNLEFPYADFGAIGLETAFSLAHTHIGKQIGLGNLVQKWAVNPRQLLSLEVPIIQEGATANFFVFNPDEEWTFSSKDIHSKSKNTPFIGWKLKGRIKAVISGQGLFIANRAGTGKIFLRG
jgi:dihydroorotase